MMKRVRAVVLGFALVASYGITAEAGALLRPSLEAAGPHLLRHEAAGRRGFVARGPRGGVVARPSDRPGVRPVPVPRRPVVVAPAWRRPAAYWWRPGTAIAAGAAVGFLTAAAAAAYAGPPPAAGYCWHYTDPQRTQGFWDVCPRS